MTATVIVISLGLPFAIVQAEIPGTPPATRLIAANLVGGLALAGVLALAGATILRHRSHAPSPVPVVIAVWLLAGATRRIVSDTIAYFPQGPPSFDPGIFLFAVTGTASWLGLLALLLARNDFYRERVHTLEAVSVELSAPARHSLEVLRERRAAFVEIVESVIRPELVRLTSELRKVAVQPTRGVLLSLAEEVDSQSRELVRNVSRSITVAPSTPEETGQVPGQVRSYTWRDLTDLRVSITLTMILKVLVAGPWLVAITGLPAERVVLALVLSWAILLAGAFTWRALQPHVGPWAVLVTVLTYALSQQVPVNLVIGDVLPSDLAGRGAAILLAGVLTGLFASLITQGVERNRDLVRRLAEHNAATLAASQGRAQEIGQLDRQIAELLHGPVQGRLATVAVALRLSAHAPAESFPETAEACQRLLALAGQDLTSIATPFVTTKAPLSARIAAVQAQWQGFLDLRVDVTPAAALALADDHATTSSIEAAIAEAVTNASRHGGAHCVTGRVDLVDLVNGCSAFVITMLDDGCGPRDHAPRGAGLGGIEDRGATCTLMARPSGGAALTVTIPRR